MLINSIQKAFFKALFWNQKIYFCGDSLSQLENAIERIKWVIVLPDPAFKDDYKAKQLLDYAQFNQKPVYEYKQFTMYGGLSIAEREARRRRRNWKSLN